MYFSIDGYSACRFFMRLSSVYLRRTLLPCLTMTAEFIFDTLLAMTTPYVLKSSTDLKDFPGVAACLPGRQGSGFAGKICRLSP